MPAKGELRGRRDPAPGPQGPRPGSRHLASASKDPAPPGTPPRAQGPRPRDPTPGPQGPCPTRSLVPQAPFPGKPGGPVGPIYPLRARRRPGRVWICFGFPILFALHLSTSPLAFLLSHSSFSNLHSVLAPLLQHFSFNTPPSALFLQKISRKSNFHEHLMKISCAISLVCVL